MPFLLLRLPTNIQPALYHPLSQDLTPCKCFLSQSHLTIAPTVFLHSATLTFCCEFSNTIFLSLHLLAMMISKAFSSPTSTPPRVEINKSIIINAAKGRTTILYLLVHWRVVGWVVLYSICVLAEGRR